MRYAQAFERSTRFTAKYAHYAELYDLVLASLPPSPTVLEIGIANGGSLQTWRELLGPTARIIGVDLNERATILRDEGFEVVIADTGESSTWDRLRDDLAGAVDLLVDDGGHTNRQQIMAATRGVELVKDGGWIVIEDMHASFMREFGNPSPFSAARFFADLACDLHRAHPRSSVKPKHPQLASTIQYTVTATSWTALRIGRWTPASRQEMSAGDDTSLMDYDHRWDSSRVRRLVERLPRGATLLGRSQAARLVGMITGRSVFKRDAQG
jgi:Methyltransferase domain